MTEQREPLLSVRDLHVHFKVRGEGLFPPKRTLKAVNGVNYAVDEGETLAVLGESGSGKSVTAQAVMGILDMPPGKITSGEILFKDRDLLKLKGEERRKVRGQEMAMIFQDALSSLNPVLSVGQQIGELFTVHQGLSRKDLLNLLTRKLWRSIKRMNPRAWKSRHGTGAGGGQS